MPSPHVAAQRTNADVLARLGQIRLANADQSLLLEQSQQREEARPTELLVVTIDAFRSQFNSMLELFRHKDNLRETLDKQQQLNKDNIDVQSMQHEEITVEQQSNVQNIQEELDTTKSAIDSIQHELNTHAENVRIQEEHIGQIESVLDQQLQVLKELDDKCDDDQKRVLDMETSKIADEQKFIDLEAEIVQHAERFEELINAQAELEYHLKFMPAGIQRLQRQIVGRRANLAAVDEQFQKEWQILNRNPCSSYATVVQTIMNLNVSPTDDQFDRLGEAQNYLAELEKKGQAEFQAVRDEINELEQVKANCAVERTDEVSGDRMPPSTDANHIIKYRSFLTVTTTDNSVNDSVPLPVPRSSFSVSSAEMF